MTTIPETTEDSAADTDRVGMLHVRSQLHAKRAGALLREAENKDTEGARIKRKIANKFIFAAADLLELAQTGAPIQKAPTSSKKK